jgi:hypothetical protein
MQNLFLCLSNYGLRHKDAGEIEGTAPRSLVALDRGEWSVSFTPWPLYPGDTTPYTHSIRGWVGPTTVVDSVDINVFNFQESDPDSSAARE